MRTSTTFFSKIIPPCLFSKPSHSLRSSKLQVLLSLLSKQTKLQAPLFDSPSCQLFFPFHFFTSYRNFIGLVTDVVPNRTPLHPSPPPHPHVKPHSTHSRWLSIFYPQLFFFFPFHKRPFASFPWRTPFLSTFVFPTPFSSSLSLRSALSTIANSTVPPSSSTLPPPTPTPTTTPISTTSISSSSSSSASPLSATPLPSSLNYTLFDTYKMVMFLQHRGFTRSQSVCIMRTMNSLLKDGIENIRTEMICQTDLENERYLYKAALSELATELKIVRQHDHASLTSEIQLILRELESLNQRVRDDISTMKSDIAIELHHRKSDLREEAKVMDTKIQEINNKLTVLCSEVKTNIETMKFESTKDVIVRILIGSAIVLVILTGWNTTKANPTKEKKEKEKTAVA